MAGHHHLHDKIRTLQRLLGVHESGKWDSETLKASTDLVRQIQTKTGIDIDSRFGKQTAGVVAQARHNGRSELGEAYLDLYHDREGRHLLLQTPEDATGRALALAKKTDDSSWNRSIAASTHFAAVAALPGDIRVPVRGEPADAFRAAARAADLPFNLKASAFSGMEPSAASEAGIVAARLKTLGSVSMTEAVASLTGLDGRSTGMTNMQNETFAQYAEREHINTETKYDMNDPRHMQAVMTGLAEFVHAGNFENIPQSWSKAFQDQSYRAAGIEPAPVMAMNNRPTAPQVPTAH